MVRRFLGIEADVSPIFTLLLAQAFVSSQVIILWVHHYECPFTPESSCDNYGSFQLFIFYFSSSPLVILLFTFVSSSWRKKNSLFQKKKMSSKFSLTNWTLCTIVFWWFDVTPEGFCRLEELTVELRGKLWAAPHQPPMACIHSRWLNLHNCIFHEVWSMPNPYCI